MYPKQLDAIFTPARYSVIEASTKSGKTFGCLCWLFEQAILDRREGGRYWWVAPSAEQARIGFRRLRFGINRGGLHLDYERQTAPQELGLPNGCAVVFHTAEKPNNLYGDDVRAAVLDEATRARHEAWFALRSTLTATNGPARLIGNVVGSKNWAFQMARHAELEQANDPRTWHYARITAYDAVMAGVLKAEEVEDAKRTLPEWIFRELYEAVPNALASVMGDVRKCVLANGVSLADGELHWKGEGRPIVWGWDLGRKRDWTVGIALDANGRVCRVVRMQRDWPYVEQAIKEQVGTMVHALVDQSGVGDPIVQNLQRECGSNVVGVLWTPQMKQQLYEGLARAIQDQAVWYPDGVIVSELLAVEYEHTRVGVRYFVPEDLHDDCISALAMAWQGFFKELPGGYFQWAQRQHDLNQQKEPPAGTEPSVIPAFCPRCKSVLVRAEGKDSFGRTYWRCGQCNAQGRIEPQDDNKKDELRQKMKDAGLLRGD